LRGPDRGELQCGLRGGGHKRGQAGSGLGGEQQSRKKTAGRRQAAPDQARSKLVACAGQPALHGADRAAQALGRLVVPHAFQVAQDQRQPETFGEPSDLLVDHRPQLGLGVIAGPVDHAGDDSAFDNPAAGRFGPGFARNSLSDTV
jgi:hypothetical protein